MPRNDAYTTGNLLDFFYHQNYYKLFGINLSRQTNATIPQEINFTRKLEENDSAKMFFYHIGIIWTMEHLQILNLLNESSDLKFVTKKWNTVNDQSNADYDVGNKIIYNTEVLKFDLGDYSDAYILVRGNTAMAGNTADHLKCYWLITKLNWNFS